MKKFIIKNRRKRKYVKKSEKNSGYTFAKTLYGMLPMLIMVIAFMATIVISTPFRNSLSHVRLTFQLPQLSLENPILFVQTLIFDISQVGSLLSAIITAIWMGMYDFFTAAGSAIVQSIYSLNPMPLLRFIGESFIVVGTFFVSCADIVVLTISSAFVQLAQSLSSAFTMTGSATVGLTSSIFQVALIVGQFIITAVSLIIQTLFNAANFSTQITLWTSTIVLHTIIIITSVAIQFIIFVGGIALSLISYAFIETSQVISDGLNKLITVIEIPFKILGSFGLKMKPYVDVFMKHIEMTFQDLSDGFHDLGEVSKSMSSSK